MCGGGVRGISVFDRRCEIGGEGEKEREREREREGYKLVE